MLLTDNCYNYNCKAGTERRLVVYDIYIPPTVVRSLVANSCLKLLNWVLVVHEYRYLFYQVICYCAILWQKFLAVE